MKNNQTPQFHLNSSKQVIFPSFIKLHQLTSHLMVLNKVQIHAPKKVKIKLNSIPCQTLHCLEIKPVLEICNVDGGEKALLSCGIP